MLATMLAAVPAQADVAIDITGVDDVLANNIRAFLSLTRYADRDDITPDTMARLERRIPLETRRALEPLGYYEPSVDFAVVPEGNDWKVTIAVAPGPEIRLSTVEIAITGDGSSNTEIARLLDRRDLRPGLRLNHGTYEQVKSNLLRAATGQGFLDAKFTSNELVIDPEQHVATVELKLETGPQYRFGPITITQDAIRDAAMQRLLRMREGEPYSVDALLRTQYVLDDTQYFSTVEIETAERDQEKRIVPVTIRAGSNLRHRYAASVGYATDTRARGRLTWDDRRVNTRGHRMQVGLIGSGVVEEASLHYAVPVMDIALEKLDFSALARNEELGDTFSKKYELGSGLTEVLGNWQRVLFLKLSQEVTELPLEDGTL
ncbi:MAG: hypothetical protein RLZZ403_215, partial [Pseudomonadota bacterium]